MYACMYLFWSVKLKPDAGYSQIYATSFVTEGRVVWGAMLGEQED